jgi:hypothetical protein
MGSGAAWGSGADRGSAIGRCLADCTCNASLAEHLFTPAWRQHLLKHKRVECYSVYARTEVTWIPIARLWPDPQLVR